MDSNKNYVIKGPQPNILGQIEPLPSPESLLSERLAAWDGQISVWNSDPGQREFVLSLVDRGSPLWYKISIHWDLSCVINGVYYSELDQGLNAVAARHGIRKLGASPISENSDKKSKKSPLKIWRRISIGTILKTDTNDRRNSPQKPAKQVRRSNSLRLFHGRVTRKFSLKNADQDSVFRPAASEDSLWPQSQSHPIISGPVRQFVMPSPVEPPFVHATLPRNRKGHSSKLSSLSAGNLPQHTDLDTVMTKGAGDKKRPRRESEPAVSIQHRKLTRSQSLVREEMDAGEKGHRLSKYSRSKGRLESSSTEQLTPSRTGAHAYTSPQTGVNWRISRRTDEAPSSSQTLTCPGDRPAPFLLDSRSAARFSLFPTEAAVLKSGTVHFKNSDGRTLRDDTTTPKMIKSVFSIQV